MFEAADRIGLLGDAHGNLGDIMSAAASLRDHGITALIQLGDFGVVWPGQNWGHNLDRLNLKLQRRGQVLHFVHGNHDWIPKLRQFPADEDGVRWLRPTIAHLDTGVRGTFPSGRSFVAIGGANSIDHEIRTEGESWWPEESITGADLQTVGSGYADVLFSHDAPLDVTSLDQALTLTDKFWTDESLEYAVRGRRMLTRAIHAVGPELSVGGHYHVQVDEVIGYLGYVNTRTRVIILDQLSAKDTASTAILDTETLQLDFLTTVGVAVPRVPQVTDLATEHSGRWAVHTVGSVYLFDLDRRTVNRIPGRYATGSTNDRELDLRSIDVARIGEIGQWTLNRDDSSAEAMEHRSSLIRHIERLQPDEGD
ncbi:metallophosphoesterase family protein [Leifsonia sp. Leaf264]|uniref:metallophosphoesterase family protein n=1 Tax=Leifsonia sp. Leaf264 TaxID=1736314 RepID=UPI0006F5C2E3|nr:metallophosphoesterase [Leifsonia sp. Leaf264]KQO97496.1 hypothetical protein ASF30_13775 [Leifsonia sp. Leaf264]